MTDKFYKKCMAIVFIVGIICILIDMPLLIPVLSYVIIGIAMAFDPDYVVHTNNRNINKKQRKNNEFEEYQFYKMVNRRK